MLDKNKIGLALGLFMAVAHAVWALLVAIIPGPLQSSLNLIMDLHFIVPYWTIKSFDFFSAIGLVIVTFVLGYIFGWVFAWAHTVVHKNK